MTKENEFSKTFEEWYEDWFKKPFPTDKEEAEGLKADSDLQSAYEYCCKRKISVKKEKQLKQEAEEYAEGMAKYYASTHEDYIPSQFEKYLRNAYISSAEPREKRIAELEAQIKQMECCMKCGYCKHEYFVNTGGVYDSKCDLTHCDCINCKDKWELRA